MIAKKRLRQVLLRTLYHTGVSRLLQSRRSGIGVIFLLHRVVPKGSPILAPDLVITDDFLDGMLHSVRRHGWDIVSLGEVRQRLSEGSQQKNFACFTFDDGYLDNLTVALPIFRRYQAPMCVYVTSGFMDRSHLIWWPVVERMIIDRDRIEIMVDGQARVQLNETLEQKKNAYVQFLPLLFAPSETALMQLFERNGIDPVATMNPLLLDWQQLRQLAADPLVEIGCHTVSHRALSSLCKCEVTHEMADSRETLEKKLSMKVRHLAYPQGTKAECGMREFELARDLGFETAVTARSGNIFPAHRDHLTALPRLNVCGEDSSPSYRVLEGLFGASLWPHYAQSPVKD